MQYLQGSGLSSHVSNDWIEDLLHPVCNIYLQLVLGSISLIEYNRTVCPGKDIFLRNVEVECSNSARILAASSSKRVIVRGLRGATLDLAIRREVDTVE